MKYRPITQSFVGEFAHYEKEYREETDKWIYRMMPLLCLLSCGMFALYALQDFVLLDEVRHTIWFIRFAIYIPLTILVLFVSKLSFIRKFIHLYVTGYTIITGLFILIIVYVSNDEPRIGYYNGLALLFIATFTYIRLRLWYAITVVVTLLTTYIVSSYTIIDTPPKIVHDHSFFLFSIIIIGFISYYVVDRLHRENFLKNKQLQEKQDEIGKNNALLEKKIEERTSDIIAKNTELEAEIINRVNMQKALEISENKYRTILENSGDIAYTMDLTGSLVFISDSISSMGYTPEEILSNSVFTYIHPDDIPRVRDVMKTALKTEVFSHPKFRLRAKNGEYDYFIDYNSIFINEEGEKRIAGVLHNVTKQTIAEKALYENEKKFRTLYNKSNDAIFLLSGNTIIDCNIKTLEILRGTREQIIGHKAYRYSPPFQPDGSDSIQRSIEVFKELQTKRNIVLEWVMCRLDGEEFYSEISLTIMNISGKEIIQAIVRDISERKKAELALRENEEMFSSILMNANDYIIYRLKYDGRILNPTVDMVSPSIIQILGITTDDVHEQAKWFQFIHPEDLKYVMLENQRIYEKPHKLDAMFRFIHPQKGTIWLHVKALGIENEYGELEYVNGIIFDVTDKVKVVSEKRQLEDRMKQLEKMESIGMLAGGIAHDFNNLLTPIIGYSEILLNKTEKDSFAWSPLQDIHNSALKAKDMTQQLLTFSRNDEAQYTSQNLNELVENFVPILRRTIREDIELKMNLDTTISNILTDQSQINQILLNFAVNAQDAMPDGGYLEIETSEVYLDDDYVATKPEITSGNYVMMSISDTGIGMSQDVADRIFEPFFTTKKEDKGTGLGLATVYGIVRQHNGDILVYSEPGIGTTFKIYLPVTKSKSKVIHEPEKEKQDISGKETLVVVEDNQLVLDMTVDFLEEQGYNIIACPEATSCLNVIGNTEKVDLVITDVIMPNINGKMLYDQMAEIIPDLKVIFMSGYTNDAIAQHGVLEKDIDYIQKPFTMYQLASKIREVLDR